MELPVSLIKRIIKALFILLAGLIILLLIAVGIGLILNNRAERRSVEFCESTPMSSPISEAVGRASRAQIRHYPDQDHLIETFMFPGWIFNWAECHVEARGGVVTKKWVTEARD